MPIYEYFCEACGADVSLLQKMDAPAPPACTSCGAAYALKKRISMSAFHLKGGGWYSELYASKAKADNAPADGAAPPPPENKPDTPAPNPKAKSEAAPSPCAGCPAASGSTCAMAQKP